MAQSVDLAALKRRRASIQGSCTRIKHFLDSVASVTPATLAQLEERKLKLDLCWANYEDVQTSLELHDDSEADQRIVFEEAFYSTAARIRELLAPSFTSRTAAPMQSSFNAHEASESNSHVRLPKLNLPTFSGRFDEWCPFYDSFQAIIHSNSSINDIHKLQYLKASLKGDAWNVISALEISALN